MTKYMQDWLDISQPVQVLLELSFQYGPEPKLQHLCWMWFVPMEYEKTSGVICFFKAQSGKNVSGDEYPFCLKIGNDFSVPSDFVC